jgi:hypothetical protein
MLMVGVYPSPNNLGANNCLLLRPFPRGAGLGSILSAEPAGDIWKRVKLTSSDIFLSLPVILRLLQSFIRGMTAQLCGYKLEVIMQDKIDLILI